MAKDPLFVIVVIAMAAVAIILMIGIGGFGRGGEFNRKYANKLMRMRIFTQFIAVVLILLFVWIDLIMVIGERIFILVIRQAVKKVEKNQKLISAKYLLKLTN